MVSFNKLYFLDAKMKMERMNLEITDLNSKKLYAFTTDEHNKILQDTVNSLINYSLDKIHL